MAKQPMSEVFGFPIDNDSVSAKRHVEKRLCPFNNKVPNCTKDKANAPLGVCSVFEGDQQRPVITCPVRFRENWLIAENAAEFFFEPGETWTSLTEVRLPDANGKSAGNIDLVMVSYDKNGQLLNFGTCEIQAVYISGNVRRPFEHFMEDPDSQRSMDWTGQLHYPRPDFLSSSRKRLAPQLLFKGGIVHSWGKKQAVVLDSAFFETLPPMPTVTREEADLVWLVYDLILNPETNTYELTLTKSVYTSFTASMLKVTTAEAGKLEDFAAGLQAKLDQQLDANPPDAKPLVNLWGEEN
jgi:hypothetical protein